MQETVDKYKALLEKNAQEVASVQQQLDAALQEKDALEIKVTKKVEELAQHEALLEEEKRNAKQRVDVLEDLAKDKEKVIADLKELISQAKEEANRKYVRRFARANFFFRTQTYKMKKERRANQAKEVQKRLMQDLDEAKQQLVGEKSRLEKQLEEVQDGWEEDRRELFKQKEHLEQLFKSEKEQLLSQLRNLAEENNNNDAAKWQSKIQVLELDKMTVERKLDQLKSQLETKDDEVEKIKRA